MNILAIIENISRNLGFSWRLIPRMRIDLRQMHGFRIFRTVGVHGLRLVRILARCSEKLRLSQRLMNLIGAVSGCC